LEVCDGLLMEYNMSILACGSNNYNTQNIKPCNICMHD